MNVKSPSLTEHGVHRTPRHIWIVAAVIAISLHAAIAAVAHISFSEEGGDQLGAPGLEIGMELLSPEREENLPPGPPDRHQDAQQAISEQKEVVEEKNVDKGTPTETDDPDRVVSPNAVDKPIEEENPEIAQKAQKPQEAQEAHEDRGLPTVETAKQSEKSVTTVQGVGDSVQLAKTTWQKTMIALQDRNLRYPPDRVKGETAEVVVSFIVNRAGRILSPAVTRSSGDSVFDEAALEMLRRSDPLPAPPAGLTDEQFSYTRVVSFTNKKKH